MILKCSIWAFWRILEYSGGHEFSGHLDLCTIAPFRPLIRGCWKLRGPSVKGLLFLLPSWRWHTVGHHSPLSPPQNYACEWQRCPGDSRRWGKEATARRGSLVKTPEFLNRNSFTAAPHPTWDLWLSSPLSPKNPSALAGRNSEKAYPQEPQPMNQQTDN